MKIVQKYGGSSLADADRVRRVASRIYEDAKNNRMLVVVSAQGKTTDALTQQYRTLSDEFPSRESDALLISGEQMSAALLAAALRQLGADAVSLNGFQVPITVSGAFGDGRIRAISTAKIRAHWSKGRIVVVTGFQGCAVSGDLMTLGRGGSDTSAVALAAALKADRCMIFTDVDGVYSADPRKESDAVRFSGIHEDTMLNLAQAGAKVLHPRAAALAKEYRVPVTILTSFSQEEGTVVSPWEPKRVGVTSLVEESRATVSVVFDAPPKGTVLSDLVKCSEEFDATPCYGSLMFRASGSPENADELMHRIHSILYQK